MRLARGFALLAVLTAAATAQAQAAGGPEGGDAKSGRQGATKGATKRAAKTTTAGAKVGKKSRRGKTPKATTARAPRATARTAGLHTINENVKVTPFPSHAAAAEKALAQNRRDKIDDAEKAARADHQDDRWQTVLFHIRELDGRSDAEACFWRVVAYYRLGEVGRARTIRDACELGPQDVRALEAEDALSAGMQPAATLPEMLAAGEHSPTPVANPGPYAGVSPTRVGP
jgi:hypothetical protein